MHEPQRELCPHCRTILFVKEGKCEECGGRVAPPKTERIVFDQWPLKRWHAFKAIDDIEFIAGQTYYEHWYRSGLSPMKSINMERVSSSPDFGGGMPASLKQAHHRKQFRLGQEALGGKFRKAALRCGA